MAVYKLISGSAAEAFHLSRKKIKLYGGGFANGKTTALVAATLSIARDYPGAAILLARATYPKLNSTLRREFINWCPPEWIKSFDKTKDNTCVLRNGTVIDFRYIDMQGSSTGEATSNLLSANYDLAVIDQVDDPEITYSDFLQVLGRLRGNAQYKGTDPTMPKSGPRWLLMSCNPTLGWPYRQIVKPLHDLRAGVFNPNLLCVRDQKTQEPILDKDGKPIPIVDAFEASTMENAQNIAPDYLETLLNTYSGKMRDRYILGKWVAFEGVVYDEFDDNIHMVPKKYMLNHLRGLRRQGFMLTPIEGYDFGIAQPSCYLNGVLDDTGVMHVVDGYYERNMGIALQAARIEASREELLDCIGFADFNPIHADPQIFKRTGMGRDGVSPTIAQLFSDENIDMQRGNNEKMNGILRVKSRLMVQQTLLNPYTHAFGCPQLMINNDLRFIAEEFNTYRWKTSGIDDKVADDPLDKDDHAMDVLKYMCSADFTPARQQSRRIRVTVPTKVFQWSEGPDTVTDRRSHRYAG